MDKNAIKKYAVSARRELISRVSQKALQYGIAEDNIVPASAASVNGVVLSADEIKQRKALIEKINKEGYHQVCEEVAYTWFNRFIALRFMEVNGYLPSRVRVFTDDENNFKPQILTEAINMELEGLDMAKVYALKNANDDDALFKYLIIVQCNALSRILPGMFQRISDYTELLFPDNLLREGSVIQQMITMIPEDNWTDQVQIIGWLYQYYNTEPKDQVFADLKKNIKISKEKIPAATQLFTPDWIVRYMVENSLGRLWLEGHPNDELKSEWKYYLDEAEQELEVQAQLAQIRKDYAALKPEDIKCIDPCMGSGHILCYLFDVLVRIYEDYGYTAREAVSSIVEKNLWGLDIDQRAAQLAYFAVMMKARQYDRRFLSRKNADGYPDVPQPHVYAITESNGIDPNAIAEFVGGDPALKKAMDSILKEMRDAKEYGSILNITPVDFDALYTRFDQVYDEFGLNRGTILDELLPLVRVAETLARRYDVVVTNPPYMGASNMSGKLNDFIKKNYADYKSDFFSAFFVRCSQMALPTGKLGFFSPYVWMFIQSYEKWRNLLCQHKTIETLIQFEYSAFEEATVPVCTFVFSNYHIKKCGCYFRLTDFRGGMEIQRQKTLEAIANHQCGYYYEQSTDNFSKIPGSPVAYWVSEATLRAFSHGTIQGHAVTKQGFKTGDNERFLRRWFEVDLLKSGIYGLRRVKWYPCTKGGEFRRWYGNLDYVVNWENDGFEIKNFFDSNGKLRSRPQNLQINFHPAISWSSISSSIIHFRIYDEKMMYESKGPVLLSNSHEKYLLGYVNSKVYQSFINIIAPTLDYSEGAVIKAPYSYQPEFENVISSLVNLCINDAKIEWDSFETSWDFTRHPLVRGGSTVMEAYATWERECDERFNTLKANEEELNRIFIDIYGLQDELTPEVEDKDVTVRKADLRRDIRSLISYAVGCMFGRYSIFKDGLIFAGGEWDYNRYENLAWLAEGKPDITEFYNCSHFFPDQDGIIPICDDEYFRDDIVGRFIQFIEVVYGKDTLEENLRFIADALGGKGQPKDVIRNYFLNDFYADHCKTYQKRPIYWLFDSGKRNGFKCLIYMHRYQPDSIARIRTDYVHEQQSRYRTAIADLEQRIQGASTSERVKLTKQLQKIQAQAEEVRVYEEKIHHLADQYISIDLDDGVKKNYEIFKDVLAKIK